MVNAVLVEEKIRIMTAEKFGNAADYAIEEAFGRKQSPVNRYYYELGLDNFIDHNGYTCVRDKDWQAFKKANPNA